jgi:predicted aspartyl protease
MNPRTRPTPRPHRRGDPFHGPRAALTLVVAVLVAFSGAALAEPVALPLERSPQGHLLIDGTLGGRPARWIVDTAATGTALTATAVEALGLQPVHGAERTVHASGGSVRTSVYDVEAAGAGGRVLDRLRTVALPEGVSVGTEVTGLLGTDWLRLSMPEFDFERGRLTLHDRAAAADVRERLRAEGFVPVPFRPDRHGLLVFQVQVGDGNAFAVLDTGADRSVFNWPAAALAGIAAGDPRLAAADRIGGASGHHVDSYAAPLGRLRASGTPAGQPPVEWADVTALVADMPVYDRLRDADLPTVTIGMDLLRQKRGLVVDFTGHRFWIR